MSKGDHRLTRETLVKNIRAMRQPTQLLRVADNGRPKFKTFNISSDHKFLLWDSTNKRPEQTRIALNDIIQVVYGQRTEKFNKARRKDLDAFSFSIICRVPLVAPGGGPVSGQGTDSLDLVCKDEKEFTVWAQTMLAISENKIDEEMWQQAELLQDKGSEPTHQKNNASVAMTSAGNEHQETSDMYAFGWGEWGQIANAREVTTVSQPKLVESLLGKGTIAIACGWSHTTILLETGTVLQVGNRLGTGLSEDYFTPMATEIMERQNVVAISCGSFHTLAMTEKGEVLAWGCNVNGQLGLGHTKDQKKPTLLSTFRDQSIKKIACGHYSSLALADDGTVFTWGCGEHGALGHNDTKDYNEPTAIQDLFGTDIIRVAAGGQHMFACTARETYAWGWNACGQLGLGHEEDQLRPHVVDTLRGNQVKAIACGAAHSIAVVHMPKIGNNVVFSWGSNCCGQLGQDKKTNISKPLAVPLFSGGTASGIEVVDVACGDMHTCLKTGNGNVYACGNNAFGQLGLGHTQDVSEFKIIAAFRDKEVRSVMCGGEHTAVLTARAWVADHEAKECMNCKSAFTFVNRKHHCRNCGGIFCSNCSSKKIALLRLGITEPVRACEECFRKLGGR